MKQITLNVFKDKYQEAFNDLLKYNAGSRPVDWPQINLKRASYYVFRDKDKSNDALLLIKEGKFVIRYSYLLSSTGWLRLDFELFKLINK